MSDARDIAVCRDYAALIDALVRCCTGQGISRAELDAAAGLPDGLASKLLSPRKRGGRRIRGFGRKTLGPVLEVLDAEIVLRRREAPATDLPANHASEDASERKPARQDWRRNRGPSWGKRMAALRALLLTAEERSASARTAAHARWQRHRLPVSPD